jgi:hypothetical protein
MEGYQTKANWITMKDVTTKLPLPEYAEDFMDYTRFFVYITCNDVQELLSKQKSDRSRWASLLGVSGGKLDQ